MYYTVGTASGTKELFPSRESILEAIDSLKKDTVNAKEDFKKNEISVEEYNHTIELAHQSLEKYHIKLKQYDAYCQSKTLEERTLRTYIYSDTTTLDLFDEFETWTDEGFKKYQRIIITNPDYGSKYKYLYIIERCKHSNTVGDITITEFKQEKRTTLRNYVNQQITTQNEKLLSIGTEIHFSKPYRLRAQTSSHRSGYGYGERLYGETNDYAFTGIIIRGEI